VNAARVAALVACWLGFAALTPVAAQEGRPASPTTVTVAGQACVLGATCGLAVASNAITGNVSLNNAANYFDGPSMAQGTTGTWFASGQVLLNSSGGTNELFRCKLWDGTTIIASASVIYIAGNGPQSVSLAGYLAAPAGNIRISCRDTTSTNGTMNANVDGVSNTASSIFGVRIN
jgi:hypothetical protein